MSEAMIETVYLLVAAELRMAEAQTAMDPVRPMDPADLTTMEPAELATFERERGRFGAAADAYRAALAQLCTQAVEADPARVKAAIDRLPARPAKP